MFESFLNFKLTLPEFQLYDQLWEPEHATSQSLCFLTSKWGIIIVATYLDIMWLKFILISEIAFYKWKMTILARDCSGYFWMEELRFWDKGSSLQTSARVGRAFQISDVWVVFSIASSFITLPLSLTNEHWQHHQQPNVSTSHQVQGSVLSVFTGINLSFFYWGENSHNKISHFKLNNSVVFNTFIVLGNHFYLVSKHIYLSKRNTIK